MSGYVYVNGSSNPVANVGGNYSNDLNAGVSYLNANYSTSNANDNIGSRLIFINNIVIPTSALAGTRRKNKWIGSYRIKGASVLDMKAAVVS
ncbi:MAG: hypothetical protein IJT54_02495 [Candidatus Methanomethylophilaceae archaeon]|nr:hypothetical protein [Candidatus Methanomethylophilaceae archaeon]